MQTVELILIPQNEGQDLNYSESFKGNAIQLKNRLYEIVDGLKKTLPEGTFSVFIEDKECTNEWWFNDGVFYGADGQEITSEEQYLLPAGMP